MAEAVGIIASGCQFAGLVGTIIKAGFQIRKLYHEIQDASREVTFRLQELQILSEVLESSESVSLHARNLCEMCLSELHSVLDELDSQIRRSRGIRRKVASAKVMIKKDVMQNLESRLERSVQLLMLAHQTHTSSTQRLVVDNQNSMSSTQNLILHEQQAILCLLKTHLNQSQMFGQEVITSTFERGHTKHHSVATSYTSNNIRCPSMCVEDCKVSRLAWSGMHKPTTSWTFGLSCATGAIQLERLMIQDSHCEPNKQCASTKNIVAYSLPTVRVQVVLPRWLSYKTLDLIAWKAQIGWKQHLRMRNIFPVYNSWDRRVTPFNRAAITIHSGSINQLRSHFENNELTPWDEDSHGGTLLTCAVANCRWDICHYLMDLGVSMPYGSAISEFPTSSQLDYQFHPFFPAGRTRLRVEAVDNCRKFMGRVDEDHTVIFSLLYSYTGSIDEFLTLRRSVWPDSRFYHPDFSLQRMLIAVGIACDVNNMWIAAPMCRSALGLDNGITQNKMHFDVRTGCEHTLFHGLAMKVGSTHGTEKAGEWHAIIRDVLRHLEDIRVLSQHGSLVASEGVLVTMTPFSVLISEGLQARLGFHRQQVTIRATNSAAVLAGCERTIFAWLADLYEAGIDLQLYGENEKHHFRHQELSRHQGYPSNGMIYRYCGYGPWPVLDRLPVYGVRLVNFHYGRLATDWKFWWSEPSDDFVEDFWCLVEARDQVQEAVLSVPGAWVD